MLPVKKRVELDGRIAIGEVLTMYRHQYDLLYLSWQ